MRYLTTAIISIVLFTSSFAQASFDTDKMDSLLNYFFDNGKASVAVAINRGGETIYENAAGLKDIQDGRQIAPDPQSRYRIGSITKTFTATLIMKVIEEGELTLDDRLERFYPNMPNADKITIEHMLRHRSGLHNFTDNSAYVALASAAADKSKLKEMLEELPTDFEPGEKYAYCNTGYILLGYILEDIYGSDYFTLVQDKIAKPLGLTSLGWMDKVDVSKNEVKSFFVMDKNWEPFETHTKAMIVGAAGAITSSAADLASFWHALFNGKLMSSSSVDKMQDYVDNYGFGLFPVPYGQQIGVSHNGGVDGFNSNASYWKKDDLSVVIFVNGLNMQYNNILIGVLSILNDDPYKFPTWESVEVDQSILKTYEGNYGNEGFPLDIKIFVQDGRLFGQATGQGAFAFAAKSDTEFVFDGAGIKVIFDKPNGFHFSQNGLVLDFVKK